MKKYLAVSSGVIALENVLSRKCYFFMQTSFETQLIILKICYNCNVVYLMINMKKNVQLYHTNCSPKL